ncbi:MAG: hypothetical protein KF760_22030 [Candidatus Eremiobacteraeota bacterium]|nr:hypothetical protein [Candidatus Eremiobacteraeota bacterium]MCW5866552.1 hypothetical protein [Candidatus Eremiobacteraeota bacterium]
MRDAFDDLVASRPNWGAATVAAYLAWWLEWQQFLPVAWHQAERRHIEEFQRQQLWKPTRLGRLQTANTIDQGLRFLRHLYVWAHGQGLVRKNPMEGWTLPRPPQPERRPLTVLEALKAFNAPDLSKPAGQADLVLLHLLYQGFSAERCRCLRLDQLDELPDDQALQLALSRYLEQGRPEQLQTPNPYLIQGARGPFRSDAAIKFRLYRYDHVLKRRLTPRLLNQSRLAHAAEAEQRHSGILAAAKKESMGEIT